MNAEVQPRDGATQLHAWARELNFERHTRSGLRLRCTSSPHSATFTEFFAAYDRAFVLPDEKEDEGGFVRCLELNHGQEQADLASRYGPFLELCVMADADRAGPSIGGANFIAAPAFDANGDAVITANLNYIFIDEQARGQGHFRRLFDSVRELMSELFVVAAATQARCLVFIEQNDPLRMSAEDYARDTEYSGIDQLDRLRIWARLGARVVDFPYVQPALSAEQEPDPNLVYSVLGATTDSIDAAVLAGHLRRFFGVSVLKGQLLDAQACVAEQLQQLAHLQATAERVTLLDPSRLLARITPAALPALRQRADSFRAAVRSAD